VANGNPSFNNPAVFVGTMDEPTKKVGSTAMAREEKTMKKTPKKMTLSEFNTMVRGMVKEALVKELTEAKGKKKDPFSKLKTADSRDSHDAVGKRRAQEDDKKKSKKDMDAAKKKGKLQEFGTQPPPVPARAMIQSPQKVGGPPTAQQAAQPGNKSVPPPVPNVKPQPVDINAVMAKRQAGQPLTPEEKRAYLDNVANQNKTAQGQAQQQAAQSPVGQSLNAIEKNPNQFVK
jgi:hypothetical protein